MDYKSSKTESLPVACTTFLNAYFYVFGLLKLREITKDKLLDKLHLFVPITVLPMIFHAEPRGFRYKDSSTLPVYLIQCID